VLHILVLCSGRLLYPSGKVPQLQYSGDHQNSVSPAIQKKNALIRKYIITHLSNQKVCNFCIYFLQKQWYLNIQLEEEEEEEEEN
jgi:hypothetical protein